MTSYRSMLSGEDRLCVSRTMGCAFGLNAAIFLGRVNSWLESNEKNGKTKGDEHFRDGRWWCYNTQGKWIDDIEVFSKSTLRRATTHLESLGIVISTSEYNKFKNDHTKWYSIDYNTFDLFMELWELAGKPNGNRQADAYKNFLKSWSEFRAITALVGLFKMGSRDAQDGQLENSDPPVPPAQDEQGITNYDSTTNKHNDSAPSATNALNDPQKARKRDPMFDAVKELIFCIDGDAEGGRIGKISNWLKRKYEGPKGRTVGYISEPAKPEHVGMFVTWYKANVDADLPRDFEKFVERWREWGTAVRQGKVRQPVRTMSPATEIPETHQKATPEQLAARVEQAKRLRMGVAT